jgi:hypothetical protein
MASYLSVGGSTAMSEAMVGAHRKSSFIGKVVYGGMMGLEMCH